MALWAIILVSTLLASDIVVTRLITEEAEAVRPIIVVVEMNATSPYQDGNMAWVLSGPSRIDGSGNTVETGKATVEGKITIYKVARVLRQIVMVNLTARSEGSDIMLGDPVPREFYFRASVKVQTLAFKLDIRLSAPQSVNHTTADMFPPRIVIEGKWYTMFDVGAPNSEGDVEPHYVYVRIKPFYYMIMTTDPPFVKMMPGQTKQVDLVIQNQGNAHDRYDLTLPNQMTMADRGWVIQANTTSLIVPPMAKGRIRLTITSPRAFHSPYHMGTQTFSVMATSLNTQKLVESGELLTPMEYQTDVQVQMLGPDFVYVPAVWAFVLFWVLALVLFNFGINIFTLRRRRFLLPEGKDPGFIYLAKRIAPSRGHRRPRAGAAKDGGGRAPISLSWKGPTSKAPEGRPTPVRPATGSIAVRPTTTESRSGPVQEKKRTFGFGGRDRSPASAQKAKDPTKGLNEILEDL